MIYKFWPEKDKNHPYTAYNHSNAASNSYLLGNKYTNPSSYSSYQPISSSTSNHTVSNYNPSASTNGTASNYNNNDTNTNREEKWNELDTMLGAQSALLSRLESDFVANRNKMKNPPANTNNTTQNGPTQSGYQPNSASLMSVGKYQSNTVDNPPKPAERKKPLRYLSSKTEKLSGSVPDHANDFQKFSSKKVNCLVK